MHDHDHESAHAGHDHDHGPAPRDFGSAFAFGTVLNLGFVVIEAVSGYLAGSMALIADAGHNLSDVLGLILAWGAALLKKRPPSERYTYGYRSTSILAALVNAMVLLIAVGAIAVEALRRLMEPAPVESGVVMAVAAVGIVVNGLTAWLFTGGHQHDLNVKGAYLHMLADTVVSAGVVLAGLTILATGWNWIDPAVSLVIAGVIVAGTWGLLTKSASMALHGVPPGIDPAAVRRALEALPGVAKIHDLHIWPMSTTETALTCHLVMPGGCPGDAFIHHVCEEMAHGFGIGHTTIQVERGDGHACCLEPDHVV
jgi:cobalt-zinc-cadmium efflux system protein